MEIKMLGIDHSQATLDVRAIFSLTKTQLEEALLLLQKVQGVKGCIILSTCNRTEIWIQQEKVEVDLYQYLSVLKGEDAKAYFPHFIIRKQEEAIFHLFQLTSGLKSQILGEDQIVTQVKNGLELARELGCTNNVLEVLFRKAITASKRVKSDVVFPRSSQSMMKKAVNDFKQKGVCLKGKQCMVIGNGQMGKEAAKTLLEEGAMVYVTVRQYHHHKVEVPKGSVAIEYDLRKTYLPQCDVIVSATVSPHYTLTKSMVAECTLNKPLTMIDLAVPRDIEGSVIEIPEVTLTCVDDFRVDEEDEILQAAKQKAQRILDQYIQEFYQWLGGHEVMPHIQFVKDEVVSDLSARLARIVQQLELEEPEKRRLTSQIEAAADKTFSKVIFGLKDALEYEDFLEGLYGLEQLYEE